MSDDWIGYSFELEEGPAFCLFNVGLGESCPDDARPMCTLVRVPFLEPGEHGLGSQEEREAIGGFEDSLEQALAPHGVAHFATLRGAGNIDLWFYSSPEDVERIEAAARELCEGTGYDVEVGSQEDAGWEQFQTLYPEADDMAAYADHQLISTLIEQGDRIEEPRPVDHAAYFETSVGADEYAQAVEAEGFEITDREHTEGDETPFLVQCTKMQAVDPDSVARMREHLRQLAESCGGTYDGWQTPLKNGDSSGE